MVMSKRGQSQSEWITLVVFNFTRIAFSKRKWTDGKNV